jgi:hypothetical protein
MHSIILIFLGEVIWLKHKNRNQVLKVVQVNNILLREVRVIKAPHAIQALEANKVHPVLAKAIINQAMIKIANQTEC